MLEHYIAVSESSKAILELVERIAPYDATVLITGESGVGKSMYARIIHDCSKRKNGSFVEINCSAIPQSLFESELFGYESGSFTGAKKEGKVGLIESAEGGTLFLDEVSEIPLDVQVKLLNVIQSKQITRIGSTTPKDVDFRLVTASNKNLKSLIAEGKFREDLYYRLNVVPIKIAPLRRRPEDVIPLMEFFVKKANDKYGFNKTLDKDTYGWMIDYDWPGNVRELENIVERVLLITKKRNVNLEEVFKYYQFGENESLEETNSLKDSVERFEKELIMRAYYKCGTTTGVAKALKISQSSAARKIQKYIQK